MYPTRTARFGVALVNTGNIRLKAKIYATDMSPIEEHCQCPTCQSCTKAYLHNLLKEDDGLAAQYVTIHNISYMMQLMRSMRQVSY